MSMKDKQNHRELEARTTRIETLLGIVSGSDPHYEIADPDVAAVRATLGAPVPDRAVHRALILTGGGVAAATELLRLQFAAKPINGAPAGAQGDGGSAE